MTHANRGKVWEQLLEMHHARYERQGRAVVLRTPPPMRILRALTGGQFVACYATEGPPDYMLLTGGLAVALEAKDCASDRWPLAKLHAHQARRLGLWEVQSGFGAVLLRHQPSDTQWVLPWKALGPVWWRWHADHATDTVPRGGASLGVGQLMVLGHPFHHVDGHLPTILASR